MESKKTTKKKTTKKKSKPEVKKAEGLGDVVETVLEKTGISKIAKFLLGEDCGCEERKEKLNKMFPRYKKPECLIESEYKWLKGWYSQPRGRMKSKEQQDILLIYNRVFKTRQAFTTCASCLRDLNDRMRLVFDTYTLQDEKK
tara:strand:- start:4656 stop:5084 length:429 start_codon:yes stop_codon:yes gene_type:complete